MTSLLLRTAALAAALCFGAGSPALAAIQLDFQEQGGITQPGFTAVESNVTMHGGIKVTTTGLFFNRADGPGGTGYTNGAAFSYENLLDDFAYAGPFDKVGSAPVTLTFEGLIPTQQYLIQIWSADYFTVPTTPTFAQQIKTTYTPFVGTGDEFSSVFSRVQNPTTNDQFSGTGLITSDNTGKIVLRISAKPNDGYTGAVFTRLNGLSLQAVPEPASIAVWSALGLGTVFLAYRKRRRSP
jgi:hypothetical protein